MRRSPRNHRRRSANFSRNKHGHGINLGRGAFRTRENSIALTLPARHPLVFQGLSIDDAGGGVRPTDRRGDEVANQPSDGDNRVIASQPSTRHIARWAGTRTSRASRDPTRGRSHRRVADDDDREGTTARAVEAPSIHRRPSRQRGLRSTEPNRQRGPRRRRSAARATTPPRPSNAASEGSGTARTASSGSP
jgi:hypothetical protein